jgi:hypothetical protein
MSNQNQLNFIVPIAKPVKENYNELKALIQQLGNYHTYFDAIGTVHFARFLFLEKDTICTDEVHTKFALLTSYDGDFDKYVQDFVDKVAPLFNELFKHLEGGKEVIPVEQKTSDFAKYLMSHNQESAHWYSAYPQLSVVQILAKFPPEN